MLGVVVTTSGSLPQRCYLKIAAPLLRTSRRPRLPAGAAEMLRVMRRRRVQLLAGRDVYRTLSIFSDTSNVVPGLWSSTTAWCAAHRVGVLQHDCAGTDGTDADAVADHGAAHPPGTKFLGRQNQLDIRAKRMSAFKRRQIEAQLDVYTS